MGSYKTLRTFPKYLRICSWNLNIQYVAGYLARYVAGYSADNVSGYVAGYLAGI